jgi:hypothetical protein
MNKDTVTIFVHGTFPVGTHTLPFIHTFFFCPQGLTLAKNLDTKFHLSKLATLLSNEDPAEYNLKHFYFFGWPGTLSFRVRKEAARELYEAIRAVKNELLNQGKEPFIRLITHSHGGNVALYLKEYTSEKGFIDELIMLACPVQVETADYSKEPLFKAVFSFYSAKDLLQVLDPQGIHSFLESLKSYGFDFTLAHVKDLGPLFSERQFPSASHIKQLHVKHPHRELLHLEFLFPPFIKALPSIIASLKEGAQEAESYILR